MREEQEKLYYLLNESIKRECERSLEAFTKAAWHLIEPGTPLIWNWHLSTICGYLEAFHNGQLPDKRLIINIPPGTLKSILVSVMYPAWTWIKESHLRYLCITNEQGLAIRDALRMKQIVSSQWYQSKWPIELKQDQNEKTLYLNDKNGHRQSQGITSSNTGKRGDCLLIDDPIDAKQAFSDVIRKSVNDTWDQSLSSRLNHLEESGVILIMQRLHEMDLSGYLREKVKSHWTILSIPMRYEGFKTFDAGRDINRPELDDPREEKGELLFPKRFSKKAVESLEEDLGDYGTQGQLQQRPVALGGNILKENWWRIWPDDKKLPVCDHIFPSWDTAYSTSDYKDTSYSACTRWGIFWDEQQNRHNIILLGGWADRVDYPDLRKKAIEITKENDIDCHLIEKKASGQSLIQDLRRTKVAGERIRVRTYQPDRDKISRAYAVQEMFHSGQVYRPNKPWAEAISKQVAKFPSGAPPSSDYTDTVTQALLYLRNGLWVTHPDDDVNDDQVELSEEELEDQGTTKVVYYG